MSLYYQIQTFFRIGIEYKKRAAYCVRLDRVPTLDPGVQEKIKTYITKNKELGTNTIPRRFSSHEGKANVYVRMQQKILYMYMVATPLQAKAEKCCTIIATAFSQEMCGKLNSGKFI